MLYNTGIGMSYFLRKKTNLFCQNKSINIINFNTVSVSVINKDNPIRMNITSPVTLCSITPMYLKNNSNYKLKILLSIIFF